MTRFILILFLIGASCVAQDTTAPSMDVELLQTWDTPTENPMDYIEAVVAHEAYEAIQQTKSKNPDKIRYVFQIESLNGHILAYDVTTTQGILYFVYRDRYLDAPVDFLMEIALIDAIMKTLELAPEAKEAAKSPNISTLSVYWIEK